MQTICEQLNEVDFRLFGIWDQIFGPVNLSCCFWVFFRL